ncbi:MAG: DUF1045 domain-containing protein [Pseudotabrizicola sp.]|uniref:DUF1045 domain-containing protein n=1 Tax=Pseudotabrizicola sp. TaxID=2939647 RepID=UPI002721EAED|nr:DUF1045 domain-containing protein [Pseudotabrizicola sp.]MDO9639222.1 DUF1045 domain-containing protein [Pseudotabrizicola sp.]
MTFSRHTHVTNPAYAATMDQMKRFAVYYAPRPGAFADATAALLGWDNARACPVPQPDLPGLPAPLTSLTSDPRKYGFHGTLRAPFRPAASLGMEDVADAVRTLSRELAPVSCDGLRVENLHGFLALTPSGDLSPLNTFAATIVRATNPLRAPLNAEERARRRPETLTPRQLALLDHWGYPHVLEEFHFHLTLTNRLTDAQAARTAPVLSAHLAPILPKPFTIEDLCLFGEDAAGRFHLLHRFPLSG